jgi:Tol biopolymer transport system component
MAAAMIGIGSGSRDGSADSGMRLAFVRDGALFVADADGSHPDVVLARTAGDPCGSYLGNRGLAAPDGRHLAVRTAWDDVCEGTVTIADPAGSVLAQVPGIGWDIAWSPDGSRFATWLSFEPPTIAVYERDGARHATLDASIVCCGDFDPTWSPDGLTLLAPARTESGEPAVAALPLDGARSHVLPPDDFRSNLAASISPDGTRVAYVSQGGQLVVSQADGTQPRVLISDPAFDAGWGRAPTWAASGDRVAIAVRQDAAEVWVIDVASGSRTMVPGLEGDDLRPVRFSSSGGRILVRRSVDDRSELVSVSIDGSAAPVVVAPADAGDWLVPADGEEHDVMPP